MPRDTKPTIADVYRFERTDTGKPFEVPLRDADGSVSCRLVESAIQKVDDAFALDVRTDDGDANVHRVEWYEDIAQIYLRRYYCRSGIMVTVLRYEPDGSIHEWSHTTFDRTD